ncbi:MAG: DUF177 domain-containing protein [Chloroflexi bacterium]|nr:DUF177 domain-containing protein [Chloroflexota bacterium]
MNPTNLRFNFGYLIEAPSGTSSDIEINYPSMRLDDVVLRPLNGQFRATRTSEGILIQGQFQTLMETECVRCLEMTLLEVETAVEEIFYYPAYTAPEGDYVVHEDGNADLGPLVREMSLLALPMQVLCKPDCLGLCPDCGQNFNVGTCDCEPDDIDPRLAVLRSLLKPAND